MSDFYFKQAKSCRNFVSNIMLYRNDKLILLFIIYDVKKFKYNIKFHDIYRFLNPLIGSPHLKFFLNLENCYRYLINSRFLKNKFIFMSYNSNALIIVIVALPAAVKFSSSSASSQSSASFSS